MESKSLYVHIPFCEHICCYCDFCKVFYNQKSVDLYLKRLEKELQSLHIQRSYRTIYIGGGTPSCLNYQQLKYLMTMFMPYCQDVEEYCIEVNPESMDDKKLMILKEGGVNRLSIGVQTFQEHLLPFIDRHHSNQEVLWLIQKAQEIGLNNISIDLMYGLPYQNQNDIQKDLDIVETLPIQHLSYYSLILEDHTVLKNRNYQLMDDESEYQINLLIDHRLEKMGLKKYEISNYARDGYQSKHNLAYWHYDNYIGIGIGACSKIDDQIIEHSRSLTKYLQGEETTTIFPQTKEDMMFNHIMMSLRLIEGLDIKAFEQCYQIHIFDYYQEALHKNLEKGYLIIKNGYLKTTAKSIYCLNEILVDFI